MHDFSPTILHKGRVLSIRPAPTLYFHHILVKADNAGPDRPNLEIAILRVQDCRFSVDDPLSLRAYSFSLLHDWLKMTRVGPLTFFLFCRQK